MFNIYDKIQVGNLEEGDVLRFSTNISSNIPYVFVMKCEGTKLKTLQVNEKDNCIIENTIDCQLEDVILSSKISKEQLDEYIRQLKLLRKELK